MIIFLTVIGHIVLFLGTLMLGVFLWWKFLDWYMGP